MCFKRIWIVLVWKYGLVIYRRVHSSLLFLMLTLKRDNWALIKKREEKKKKLAMSLGLNLISMRSKEFKFRPTMYSFGLRVCVLHFGLFFFFCAWTVNHMNLLYRYKNHCSRTVTALFMYLKILKMDPTILFTHLKIILLQYFQFSVFNFNKNRFNPNGPYKQN